MWVPSPVYLTNRDLHPSGLTPWYKPRHQSAGLSSLVGDGYSSTSTTNNFPMSLVIFDKDGTLIDCNSVWLPWMEAHVQELEQVTGMQLSEQLYSAVGYCPKQNEYQDDGLLAHATVAGIKDKFKEVLVDHGLDHSDADKLVDGCCPEFDSGDTETLTPLGDLTKIFKTLRSNGVKTAVCTMDSRDGTMTALDSLGLTSLVDMIVCGDDHTSKPKPAPDNALNICKELNVCPTKTVVVGDTTADTGMGKSAGLGLIVGVKTGAGSTRALEKESHIVLNSVDEFLSSVFYKLAK